MDWAGHASTLDAATLHCGAMKAKLKMYFFECSSSLFDSLNLLVSRSLKSENVIIELFVFGLFTGSFVPTGVVSFS